MMRRWAWAPHSYHSLPHFARAAWLLWRWAVPPRSRWFFEGCRHVPGQLWYAERKLIYQTIRTHRPSSVFEIGTWQGGGSTLFVGQALFDNERGHLHTIELDPQQHLRAKKNYKQHLPHLLPYIEFHLGSSTTVYPNLLSDVSCVDVLVLDGLGEEQSLAELQLFSPYLREGSILIAHDWLDVKMRRVRPVVEGDPHWHCLYRLMPPQSVGLCVFQRQGPGSSSISSGVEST